MLSYPCIVLGSGDEDDYQAAEMSWDSRADLIASLSTFEGIELNLPLKVASKENDSFN